MFRGFIILTIIFTTYLSSQSRNNIFTFSIDTQYSSTEQKPGYHGLNPPNPLTNNVLSEEEIADETISPVFIITELQQETLYSVKKILAYKSPYLEKPLQPPRA